MFDFNLKMGDHGESVRMIQKALNESGTLSKYLVVDGDFGPSLQNGLLLFQRTNKLNMTGVYGTEENKILGPVIDRKYLMVSEIDSVAVAFNLPVSILKAIRETEGRSDGFQPDGRPIILFERHKFYSNYSKVVSADRLAEVARENADICNTTPGGYIGGAGEYTRLEKAYGFDTQAANLSTSFGMFQQMGSNYAISDYANVAEFVEGMKQSEKNHLTAIAKFISKTPRLAKAVRAKDYAAIALSYNGPDYAKNEYDIKLRQADKKYS